MQLRQNRRLPGRYREEDIPELPPNPTAVEPTIPFDPTLPPAAFPTLPLDQFPPDNIQETAPDITIISEPERPALVFRDRRMIEPPITLEALSDPGNFEPRIGEEEEGQPKVRLSVSWYLNILCFMADIIRATNCISTGATCRMAS